jgi:hypothetical protein
MTQALHPTPAEIERRLADNVRMYEEDPRGLAINKTLADHWRECLHRFHDYQEGRIDLAELPYDVRTMGWTMPSWGHSRG